MQNRHNWQLLPPPNFRNLQRPVFFRVMQIPANHIVETHDHPWGQLSFATDGVILARVEDTSYVIPPQHALWCPPHVAHELSSSNGVDFCGFYIDQPFLEQMPKETYVLEVTPLLRELIRHASTLPREYEQGGAEGRLIRCLLDQLVAAPEVGFELPMPQDNRLRQLTEQLLQQPDNNQTLETWADQIGATSRTLNRLFQKELGMGFREWRQRLRMLEAIQRLENGEAVTSVALALGYSSTSAFISRFRRLLGVTPGEYLRKRESSE